MKPRRLSHVALLRTDGAELGKDEIRWFMIDAGNIVTANGVTPVVVRLDDVGDDWARMPGAQYGPHPARDSGEEVPLMGAHMNVFDRKPCYMGLAALEIAKAPQEIVDEALLGYVYRHASHHSAERAPLAHWLTAFKTARYSPRPLMLMASALLRERDFADAAREMNSHSEWFAPFACASDYWVCMHLGGGIQDFVGRQQAMHNVVRLEIGFRLYGKVFDDPPEKSMAARLALACGISARGARVLQASLTPNTLPKLRDAAEFLVSENARRQISEARAFDDSPAPVPTV